MISESAPNGGILTFDTILSAWLNLFTAILEEGWTDIMYTFQDSSSYWISTIYFHVLIFLCSFFAMSLCLGIICDAYDKVGEHWEVELSHTIEHLRIVNLNEEVLYKYSAPNVSTS